MSTPVIGIAVSAVCVILLSLLFRFEKRRGTRLLASVRVSLDAVIFRVQTVTEVFFKHISRDLFRQSVHYFFHTILTVVLGFLKQCEKHIYQVLQMNKLTAKKSYAERRVRNKLDEIADHKESVALTDAQKKKHRAKTLEG